MDVLDIALKDQRVRVGGYDLSINGKEVPWSKGKKLIISLQRENHSAADLEYKDLPVEEKPRSLFIEKVLEECLEGLEFLLECKHDLYDENYPDGSVCAVREIKAFKECFNAPLEDVLPYVDHIDPYVDILARWRLEESI
jgi:hypothetical protein